MPRKYQTVFIRSQTAFYRALLFIVSMPVDLNNSR